MKITNDRQALEIVLKDYKKHLKKLPKDLIDLESYILKHNLHAGICFYTSETYNYLGLYNFFKDKIKIRNGYLTKIPYDLDFQRERTIESFKIRIEWLEKYLKENK